MTLKKVILRIIITAVFAAGFLIFLVPVFTNILNVGNAAGMLVCLAFAVVSVFWGKVSALFSESRAFRVTAVVIISIGAISAVLAAIISVFMVNAAHSPPSGSSTVIVLGCKVKGEVPSLMLGQRISAACRYLEANSDSVCIASGGKGADELISEAECIKRVLVEKGIAEERIILEDKSTSTDENIRFSIEKMKENGISGSVTIVTNEFHQLRAGMIAEKYGLEAYPVSARTARYLLPTYWLREWFGVIYQVVFG